MQNCEICVFAFICCVCFGFFLFMTYYTTPCLCFWHGYFVLNSALNTGFFFRLESELCVAFEFHLVSTCSRFKITLCSSPLKTRFKPGRIFVNLTESGHACFNFSLVIAMPPRSSPEGTFDQSLRTLFAQSCQTGQLCPSSVL